MPQLSPVNGVTLFLLTFSLILYLMIIFYFPKYPIFVIKHKKNKMMMPFMK